MKRNVVIFASGSGSNAANIIDYFRNNPDVEINAVFCNRPGAGVIAKADGFAIPCEVFNRSTYQDSDQFLKLLQSYNPDLIVLAGFLWMIPDYMVNTYPNKIVNIHPALLPKYGGKGMYGKNVHEAVFQNNEKESGITIHYVNEHYDEGQIIFQATCKVSEEDTPETIEKKVRALELEHYPKIIEHLLNEGEAKP